MAAHRPRRRVIWSSVALVATLGIAFGLYWFQPWKLFIDHRVNEALPQVALESPAAVESSIAAPETATPSTAVASATASTAPTTTPVATTPAASTPAAEAPTAVAPTAKARTTVALTTVAPTPKARTAVPPTRTAPSTARPQAVLLSRGSLISHEHSTSGTVSVVRQADGSRVLAIANLDTSDGPDVHVWLTDAPVIKGEKGWHVFDDGQHIDLGGLKGNVGNLLYKIPKSADLATLTSVSIWCERFSVSFGAAELAPAA